MDPTELLLHARNLATHDGGRLSDTALRRAVSACYYAMFHTISDDAAATLTSVHKAHLRSAVRRTIAHTQVRKACDVLNAPPKPVETAWRSFLAFPRDNCLIEVAGVFVELQEARYSADYDSLASFKQREVLALHVRATKVHATWIAVRRTPNAAVFLTAILLGDKLGKRG